MGDHLTSASSNTGASATEGELSISRNRRYKVDSAPKLSACNRVWMALSFIFLATSIALAAYVIYVETSQSKGDGNSEADVINRFPGYFRSYQEQQLVEMEFMNVSKEINWTIAVNGTSYDYCNFVCPAYNQAANRSVRDTSGRRQLSDVVTFYSVINAMKSRRPRFASKSSRVTYHACCLSQTGFYAPDNANDPQGNPVKVVQLQSFKQYFYREYCSHAKGCTGCSCGEEMTLVKAVVELDFNSYAVKIIKVPGCCKCFNN